jgi:hypothetical protein
MGLALLHDDDGYFLDPKTRTRVADRIERPRAVSGD